MVYACAVIFGPRWALIFTAGYKKCTGGLWGPMVAPLFVLRGAYTPPEQLKNQCKSVKISAPVRDHGSLRCYQTQILSQKHQKIRENQ